MRHDYELADVFIENSKTIAESNSEEETFNIIKEQLNRLENK
ncbi:hypothetical protein [uncultured Chryseobacterium sp.]|nr:hypothetical protein [uncultured Chryseobacterium sp.]